MKIGAIIYVSGDKPMEGLKHKFKELVLESGIKADRLEIISRTSGCFDIHDAWWHLIAKGMHLVLFMMAEVDEDGKLRLTGRQLRLCG